VTGRHGPGESGPGPGTAVRASRSRPLTLAAVLAAAVLVAGAVVAACTGLDKASSAHGPARQRLLPQRIIPAPRALLAVTGPQPDGTVWAVAGSTSVGLFKLSAVSGLETASSSISRAARSVAENSAGVVAIALGTRTSGAVELIASGVKKTASLPAPAIQVVSASAGTSFYVLTAWPGGAASVSVVSSSGSLMRTVPAPSGAVSIAADPQQGLIYALQHNGIVDEIGLRARRILTSLTVDGNGMSIAVSPDGSRLYVLKGSPSLSNIAVIDTATESVLKVLPAPSHCVQLAVSPDGRHLYEAVGSPGYGNIQVFGL
jgi:DNA-binding beta-propeller fold protein YncE